MKKDKQRRVVVFLLMSILFLSTLSLSGFALDIDADKISVAYFPVEDKFISCILGELPKISSKYAQYTNLNEVCKIKVDAKGKYVDKFCCIAYPKRFTWPDYPAGGEGVCEGGGGIGGQFIYSLQVAEKDETLKKKIGQIITKCTVNTCGQVGPPYLGQIQDPEKFIRVKKPTYSSAIIPYTCYCGGGQALISIGPIGACQECKSDYEKVPVTDSKTGQPKQPIGDYGYTCERECRNDEKRQFGCYVPANMIAVFCGGFCICKTGYTHKIGGAIGTGSSDPCIPRCPKSHEEWDEKLGCVCEAGYSRDKSGNCLSQCKPDEEWLEGDCYQITKKECESNKDIDPEKILAIISEKLPVFDDSHYTRLYKKMLGKQGQSPENLFSVPSSSPTGSAVQSLIAHFTGYATGSEDPFAQSQCPLPTALYEEYLRSDAEAERIYFAYLTAKQRFKKANTELEQLSRNNEIQSVKKGINDIQNQINELTQKGTSTGHLDALKRDLDVKLANLEAVNRANTAKTETKLKEVSPLFITVLKLSFRYTNSAEKTFSIFKELLTQHMDKAVKRAFDYLSTATGEENTRLKIKYEELKLAKQLVEFEREIVGKQKPDLLGVQKQLDDALTKQIEDVAKQEKAQDVLAYTLAQKALDATNEQYIHLLITMEGKEAAASSKYELLSEQQRQTLLTAPPDDFDSAERFFAWVSGIDLSQPYLAGKKAYAYQQIYQGVLAYYLLRSTYPALVDSSVEKIALQYIRYDLQATSLMKTLRDRENNVKVSFQSKIDTLTQQINAQRARLEKSASFLEAEDAASRIQALTKELQTVENERVSALNKDVPYLLFGNQLDAVLDAMSLELSKTFEAIPGELKSNSKRQAIENTFADFKLLTRINFNLIYAFRYKQKVDEFVARASTASNWDPNTFVRYVLDEVGAELLNAEAVLRAATSEKTKIDNVFNLLQQRGLTTLDVRTQAGTAKSQLGSDKFNQVYQILDPQSYFDPRKVADADVLRAGIVEGVFSPGQLLLMVAGAGVAKGVVTLGGKMLQTATFTRYFPTLINTVGKYPLLVPATQIVAEGAIFHYSSGILGQFVYGIPFDPYDPVGYAQSIGMMGVLAGANKLEPYLTRSLAGEMRAARMYATRQAIESMPLGQRLWTQATSLKGVGQSAVASVPGLLQLGITGTALGGYELLVSSEARNKPGETILRGFATALAFKAVEPVQGFVNRYFDILVTKKGTAKKNQALLAILERAKGTKKRDAATERILVNEIITAAQALPSAPFRDKLLSDAQLMLAGLEVMHAKEAATGGGLEELLALNEKMRKFTQAQMVSDQAALNAGDLLAGEEGVTRLDNQINLETLSNEGLTLTYQLREKQGPVDTVDQVRVKNQLLDGQSKIISLKKQFRQQAQVADQETIATLLITPEEKTRAKQESDTKWKQFGELVSLDERVLEKTRALLQARGGTLEAILKTEEELLDARKNALSERFKQGGISRAQFDALMEDILIRSRAVQADRRGVSFSLEDFMKRQEVLNKYPAVVSFLETRGINDLTDMIDPLFAGDFLAQMFAAKDPTSNPRGIFYELLEPLTTTDLDAKVGTGYTYQPSGIRTSEKYYLAAYDAATGEIISLRKRVNLFEMDGIICKGPCSPTNPPGIVSYKIDPTKQRSVLESLVDDFFEPVKAKATQEKKSIQVALCKGKCETFDGKVDKSFIVYEKDAFAFQFDKLIFVSQNGEYDFARPLFGEGGTPSSLLQKIFQHVGTGKKTDFASIKKDTKRAETDILARQFVDLLIEYYSQTKISQAMENFQNEFLRSSKIPDIIKARTNEILGMEEGACT